MLGAQVSAMFRFCLYRFDSLGDEIGHLAGLQARLSLVNLSAAPSPAELFAVYTALYLYASLYA
jgi:hypothetical protein